MGLKGWEWRMEQSPQPTPVKFLHCPVQGQDMDSMIPRESFPTQDRVCDSMKAQGWPHLPMTRDIL